MNHPGRQRGNALLIAILVLIIIILAVVSTCQRVRFPGGTAHSIQLRPVATTLSPGTRGTFEVIVVMNEPLGNIRKEFLVNIDEDDYWDDTLIDELKVVYDPAITARPYAYATFELECKDLQANGEFDLSAPGGGTSYDEAVHLVHAEGPGSNSANVSVRCTVATESESEEE